MTNFLPWSNDSNIMIHWKKRRSGRSSLGKYVNYYWQNRYEKIYDVYTQLSEHTTDAIQNAKHVKQYHIQNGNNKPFDSAVNSFADIYQLVESLL